MACGYDVVTSAKISNVAAGVVVGKIGAASVTPDELKKAWEQNSIFLETFQEGKND